MPAPDPATGVNGFAAKICGILELVGFSSPFMTALFGKWGIYVYPDFRYSDLFKSIDKSGYSFDDIDKAVRQCPDPSGMMEHYWSVAKLFRGLPKDFESRMETPKTYGQLVETCTFYQNLMKHGPEELIERAENKYAECDDELRTMESANGGKAPPPDTPYQPAPMPRFARQAAEAMRRLFQNPSSSTPMPGAIPVQNKTAPAPTQEPAKKPTSMIPPSVETQGAGSNQCPEGTWWDGSTCRPMRPNVPTGAGFPEGATAQAASFPGLTMGRFRVVNLA